jgi:hypothetical protein
VKHAVLRSLVFLFCVSITSGSAEIRLESGETQVSLLELYTSEGCSSCPPAETWIQRQYGETAQWRSIVPIAFHVDYWDQLGWKDRFAKPEFTARQQYYSANWNRSSVYTPCFVLNGEEWQGWFQGGMPPTGARGAVGNLKATIKGDTVDISFTPAKPATEYVGFVVPLAMQANSEVRAGENQGRHLSHDFVALTLVSSKLESQGSAFRTTVQASMNGARAIAVWIALSRSLVPIQAVGGPLETADGQ